MDGTDDDISCVISGVRHKINEIYALLEFYAA
jgi:hypothetical protein